MTIMPEMTIASLPSPEAHNPDPSSEQQVSIIFPSTPPMAHFPSRLGFVRQLLTRENNISAPEIASFEPFANSRRVGSRPSCASKPTGKVKYSN
jgi:hypothetical protein